MRLIPATALLVLFSGFAHAEEGGKLNHYSHWYESGIASMYGKGDGFAGKRTASGEVMNPRAMTAAHKTRKLGSHATVSHGRRKITVRINDRGPFVKGRIIDLSPAAMSALGCSGLCRVSVQ